MKKTDSFGLVPASIMRSEELSLGAKALYSLLCTYADKKRTCFPNRDTLCKALGINPHTFSKYLKQLEDTGAITIVRQRNAKGRWGSNYYQLKDATVCTKTARSNLTDRVHKNDIKPCAEKVHTNNTIYNNTIRTYRQPSQSDQIIHGENNYDLAYK